MLLPTRMFLVRQSISMHGVKSHNFASFCRKQFRQLAENMAAGQTEAAMALLTANPQLAWLKDGQTGDYPIHTACKLVRPSHVPASCAHFYIASAGPIMLMVTKALAKQQLASPGCCPIVRP